MSEATADTATPRALDPEVARKIDVSRLKDHARFHFVFVMGAITLWGAADAWATVSGLGIAQLVSGLNAIITATIVNGVLHEWGHLAGARLSGAVSPALEKRVKYFFMFDFKFDENDARQFLWMSWGGILMPWALVLCVLLLVPIDSFGRIVLLAAFVTRAIQVALFEVPVALRTAQGGDPRGELGRELKAGGLKTSETRGAWIGVIVGAVLLLAL